MNKTIKTNIKLSRKEKAFADQLLANPKASGADIAEAVYDTLNRSSARSVASQNLRKENIQQYLELHANKALQDNLEIARYSKDFGAAGGKEGASYASVAKDINKDILDRTFGKARQQIELQSTSLNLTIDLTSALPPQGTESN